MTITMPEGERLIPFPEVCATLGRISHRELYRRIEAGDLAVTRLGGRVFIKASELNRYIDSLPEVRNG